MFERFGLIGIRCFLKSSFSFFRWRGFEIRAQRIKNPDGKDIININGGVRFTGNDAQIAFSAIKSQMSSSGGLKGIHFVTKSKTPNIYKNTLNAFRSGKPEILHYDSDQTRNRQRRGQATYGVPTQAGFQRDEYPYASTFEGGKGATSLPHDCIVWS